MSQASRILLYYLHNHFLEYISREISPVLVTCNLNKNMLNTCENNFCQAIQNHWRERKEKEQERSWHLKG